MINRSICTSNVIERSSNWTNLGLIFKDVSPSGDYLININLKIFKNICMYPRDIPKKGFEVRTKPNVNTIERQRGLMISTDRPLK